jgi:hypothetical protein
MNAELGIATYSVSFPNHGDRTEFDGGYVMPILSPDQRSKTIGMVVHNAIDFASAHRALQTTLANVDFVGPKSWRSWYGNKADGVADINATRVMKARDFFRWRIRLCLRCYLSCPKRFGLSRHWYRRNQHSIWLYPLGSYVCLFSTAIR